MNVRNTIRETYRYRIFHLFPGSRKFRSLDLNEPSLSTFLLSIRKKEGKAGCGLALFLFSFSAVALSLILDIYKPAILGGKREFLAAALLYTLILSLKFSFIRINTMKKTGELIFTILAFLSTRYFALPIILLLIFESGEALSYEEV